MSILKFKQFESIQNDNYFDFPSFEDVEEYFYDFTDEIDSKLYGYQSGFKFFITPNKPHKTYRDMITDKSNFIDIINTNIPDKNLMHLSSYCYIKNFNFPKHSFNYISTNSIKNGAKSYKHLMIQFADTLFPKSKLDILIECLKRFYNAEGFRPYGDLWTEDRIKPGYSTTEESIGFLGLLVNCSDEEYIKMVEMFEQREGNKNLIKHFI